MRRLFLLGGAAAVSLAFLSLSSPAEKPTSASMVTVAPKADKPMLTSTNFEDSVRTLYNATALEGAGLPLHVFRLAFVGYQRLAFEGRLNEQPILTIIDFSQPSTAKRLYTVDLRARRILFHTWVAHGRNTGQNLATAFSNTPHSNQSSLGFTVTGETYVGSKGYSLRLDGMEKAFNSNVRTRAVVIHSAPYATPDWIARYGRLGRSQGCPALPPSLSRKIIDTIKDKTAVFTYYPDEDYLAQSAYLQTDKLFDLLDEAVLAAVR